MARRTLQIVSSVLNFMFGLALVAFTAFLVLPFFDVELFESQVFETLHQGIIETTAEFSFLDSLETWAPVVFLILVIGLPGLLLVSVAIIYVSNPHRSQFKYILGFLLALLGIGLFTAITEMNAVTLFGENDAIIWMIGVVAGALILLIPMVLSLFCKTRKRVEEQVENEETIASEAYEEWEEPQPEPVVEEQPEEEPAPIVEPVYEEPAKPVYEEPVVVQPIEPTPVVQPEPEPQPVAEEPAPIAKPETVEPNREPMQPLYEEPAPQPKDIPIWEPYYAPIKPQPEPVIPPEYIPDERKRTVSDIVENTYRKNTDNISDASFRKIRTLRSLLDTQTISKDEYIAVVDKYLQEDKNKTENNKAEKDKEENNKSGRNRNRRR